METKRKPGRPPKNKKVENNNIDELEALLSTKKAERANALNDENDEDVARISTEIKDIKERLETAKKANSSSLGISAEALSDIVNKAVSEALAESIKTQTELISQVRDLTSVLKAQKEEIAALKAEIASLKASHSKQMKEIQHQLDTVQTTSDMISSDVKSVKKNKPVSSVENSNDTITINIPRKGGVDEWEKLGHEIVEQEARKTRIDAINNVFDNVNKGAYKGISFDNLDADMQKRLLELDGYNGSDNYIYDFIKDNAELIDESIKNKIDEIDAHTNDTADESASLNDFEDINFDEFEDLTN